MSPHADTNGALGKAEYTDASCFLLGVLVDRLRHTLDKLLVLVKAIGKRDLWRDLLASCRHESTAIFMDMIYIFTQQTFISSAHVVRIRESNPLHAIEWIIELDWICKPRLPSHKNATDPVKMVGQVLVEG